MSKEFVRPHHIRLTDTEVGKCRASLSAKFVTYDTANAKVACEASRIFIHKSFGGIEVFDQTIQRRQDSWSRFLPNALGTQFLRFTERGCQRFKCAPHTLDHFDIDIVNAERRDKNKLWEMHQWISLITHADLQSSTTSATIYTQNSVHNIKCPSW